jgi:hypothetical protein
MVTAKHVSGMANTQSIRNVVGTDHLAGLDSSLGTKLKKVMLNKA